MKMQDIEKGMKVEFGRPNGEKTLARVIKKNRKTVSIKTLEERGVKKISPAGSKWRCPPSMVRPAPDAEPVNKGNKTDRSASTGYRDSGGGSGLDYNRGKKGHNKRRYMSDAEREEQAKKDAREGAKMLKEGCTLKNPPTYIKSSRRYLDGHSLRKRGNEYDSQRQKLYDSERRCRKGESFDSFRDAQRYLNKVLESAWFQRRFDVPDIQLKRGRGRSSAYWWGSSNIRLSTANHMYERVLLHELVHTLVPLPHSGHGRLFCAIYLDLVRHYMGEEAYEELLEGYRREGVKYHPRRTEKR